MIASRMCPPVMLPKRRSVSDSGRARWLMISIGIISGASAGTGPMKCLQVVAEPLLLDADVVVAKNTTSAQAAVVLRLSVGPTCPGTRPIRLPTRMNRPSVAISGR